MCNSERIKGRMGSYLRWIDNYDSDELGRIVVGRNPSRYKIIKLREADQLIHVEAFNNAFKCAFFITFVYASNVLQERGKVWNDLCNLASIRRF